MSWWFWIALMLAAALYFERRSKYRGRSSSREVLSAIVEENDDVVTVDQQLKQAAEGDATAKPSTVLKKWHCNASIADELGASTSIAKFPAWRSICVLAFNIAAVPF